jgi:uncharacterized membrane protein YgcG
MALRALVLALFAAAFLQTAEAVEQINRFDVSIDVERDGDIVVAETIDVTSEGNRIRRGIFRDLPRYYMSDGDRLPFGYDVLSVRRDGKKEPYEISSVDNATRILIGDADVLLNDGAHVYEIRYRVKNQVRYFENHDELYWNVTGNYWEFPIEAARGAVRFPAGARITGIDAYTGPLGASGKDYAYREEGGAHVFEATRPFETGEGLTISIGLAKGLIEPPSALDQTVIWWQRNGALVILIASLGGLFAFYYRAYVRVGRDPPRQPVFPRYAPPEGYSPAAVHHIYNRGVSSHRALIATLMNLAVKGRLTIGAKNKNKTELLRNEASVSSPGVAEEDLVLERNIFRDAATLTLGGNYDAGFTEAYTRFQAAVSKHYGTPYFRWNTIYVILAAAATVAAVVVSANIAAHWSAWHTAVVLALAGLNGLFMYLMPAPTKKGQERRTEIAGFRLYLETAEKLQLNAVKVGSEAPPPMTKERYEAFLPYAVALGVEKPWTEYFEKVLPKEAADYSPGWALISSRSSAQGLSRSLISSMTSGVTSALPKSSSSSGGGGGGSSGGGGGGGGGGGW